MATAQLRKQITIGEMIITHDPTEVDLFVGSCVGVVIYDPKLHNYAITHTIYPQYSARSLGKKRTLFVDTAIDDMIKELQKWGSSIHNLKAKLIGGANMIPSLDPVGDMNVFIAKKALEEYHIPILATDTGGRNGRKIVPMDLDGNIKVVVREKTTCKDIEYFL